jgi:hypothetical protein
MVAPLLAVALVALAFTGVGKPEPQRLTELGERGTCAPPACDPAIARERLPRRSCSCSCSCSCCPCDPR